MKIYTTSTMKMTSSAWSIQFHVFRTNVNSTEEMIKSYSLNLIIQHRNNLKTAIAPIVLTVLKRYKVIEQALGFKYDRDFS